MLILINLSSTQNSKIVTKSIARIKGDLLTFKRIKNKRDAKGS